ncbi:isocitrate lyase/PEP mutase family protein [Pseudoclavibacter sp. 13-3]|uniref:isocitrate lyase/PEP mutase family protein n=1 Tax=Pseudoclavibacter sp. 13-3 TaxID=2901228 RepID=UPI001E579CD1|nr:isocitrate lyase/phosphoenolpyruvate mutase family protein [Pseudoclavibacter sp. 13-3]MCD7100688.1 isocitrate lyase/phosphoenolpyruvate mutase family protein [Pseudoclavibacter sp. 13-3]
MSETTRAETARRAETLGALHRDPGILQVVNVWDAVTATVVADLPETKALATAGHSIAASHGYADGEIPLDLLLAATARIVAATELPVSADLDDGHGDAAETVRRAIDVGVVGANIEDRLRPFETSVETVRRVVAAAGSAGVDFQLNARTDAFVLGGDRPVDVIIDDAVTRGRAYLEAGAALVFVPGVLDRETTERLVDGLGRGRLSVIGLPGALSAAEYEQLGVARISYGPMTQRHALRALRDLATSLYGDGVIPEDTPELN